MVRSNAESEDNLRSASVGSSLPCLFALLTDISTGSIGASTTSAIRTESLGRWRVIHVLIVVIVATWPVVLKDFSQLGLYIHLRTLHQQHVYNLADLEVARAEPVWLAIRVLRVGLHPEDVSL
jgi:hypothetical protein